MRTRVNGFDEGVSQLISGNPLKSTEKLLEETDRYLEWAKRESEPTFPAWIKWSFVTAGCAGAMYALFQIEGVRNKVKDAVGAIGDFLMGDAIERSSEMDDFDTDFGVPQFRSSRNFAD